MVNLIEKIIEIDNEMRNNVDAAKQKAAETVAEAKEKEKQILSESHRKSEQRLETVRQTYGKFAEEESLAAEEKRDRKIRELESIMSEKKGLWKAEILGRILAD